MTELLLHRFERWATDTPDALAVCCDGKALTFAELNQRANRLAQQLMTRNVGSNALLGLCVDPSLELVIGMLGILKAGCAWVPLDPAYPSERLCGIVEEARPELILVTQRQSKVLHDLMDSTVLDINELLQLSTDKTRNPDVPIHPDDLCYVMFTSGSTGRPNGVMVSHANIAGLFSALEPEFAFSPADQWSAMHSFAFGFSVWETWGPLSTGGCLQIVAEHLRGDPAAWFRAVLDGQVTVLSITPSGFRQLLAADCLPVASGSLRLIVFSGEAVNGADVTAWFEHFGKHSPRLINTYALTETAGRITAHEYLSDSPVEVGSIGRPVRDAEVFLLDSGQHEVTGGEVGELYIGGPMLAAGYLGEPMLTAERFMTLDPGDGVVRRLYRTGDRARITNSGEILFVGRQDDQIKLRGHRIELRDIEHAIRKHPSVMDVAVVLQTTDVASQLVAFVVSQDHEPGAGEPSVEFWPSLGEYQVYDDLLYDFMSADEVRIASYKRAFERQVQGKVVLDIGTGKDAILARLCAAAGARKVYAVEVLDQAAASARRLIRELGLTDQIEVLCGDMQSIEIPEPIDICTQGIIGNIGSSDGIVSIWNSARASFAKNFVAVPSNCTTLIAPAELPDATRETAAFSPLAARYTREIFVQQGREFDVRLCVRNFPLDGLLSAAVVFEELDFQAELQADYHGEAEFIAHRDGRFDGFLLWTDIQTDAHESVSFLQHQQAWLPVWFPIADEPVELRQGDRIHARWQCITPEGQVFPDFEIDVEILTGNGEYDGRPRTFRYCTRHFEDKLGSTALHRSLLGSLKTESADIETWLRAQLPTHMLPTRWVQLPELPLNANGKIDRKQLREYIFTQEMVPDPVEGDYLEQEIAAIWRKVLGRNSLKPDEDFFAAGGDSILAVRLTTEIQRYLDDTVFLAALFDAPTVKAYAQWLRIHHGEAVTRRLGDTPEGLVAKHPLVSEAIVAADRDSGPVELSYPQQSLWFLQQLYPDNTGANEQFMIRVCGGADIERLRKAWHAVLSKHDILRTCFDPGQGDQLATQRVVSLQECIDVDPTPQESLADLSIHQARERLAADAEQALAQPFDLQRAPLLRTHLYSLPGNEQILLVTAHHIIADGMCVQLIRDELAQAYAQGTNLALPVFQYADFARWQRQSLTSAATTPALKWWQQTLAGHNGQPVSTVRDLTASGGHEARFAFEISATLTRELRTLARDVGATLFMLLLAAWRVWLARCLMEKDLLLGSPVTLRRDAATADMLGCMVNNVVFRNPLDTATVFIDVLKSERDCALAAIGHSHVPFEKVVEAVQPERHLGRHPLFQLMFLFEDRSAPPVSVEGLRFTADVLPVDRASYWDLELSVTDCGPTDAMQAFIGVRRDIYDAEALAWWPAGFVAMLGAIARDAQTPVADLPLLSPAQRKRVLVDWNDTQLAILPEETLHQLVTAQAHRTPDAIAVQDEHARVTYAELIGLTDIFASALRIRGVDQGDLVGLCIERSIDSIALQLAILKCGAAWLPLDPGYPATRLVMMLEDAAPVLVVSSGVGSLPIAYSGITTDELRATPGTANMSDFPVVTGQDSAYVLYTSGTTGLPKGVVATHVSAVSRCRWMWQAYAFSADDVFGQRTSLNFIDSVWEIFGALAHGARVDVLPADAEHNPVAIADWIDRQSVTHLVLVPSLLHALLDEYANRSVPEQLHTIISSGEALSPSLARRVHQLLADCRLLNTYGTSETWDISCYEVKPEAGLALQVPVGKPVANAIVCILDETMQPVPPGVTGELYAGGAGLAREYLHKPELTAACFVSNPLGELDIHRLYRSGDLARFRADGNVELLGRKDRQVKLRGLRIEMSDIEAQVLTRDDVAECAVVLRQQANGNGNSHHSDWLALYIVPVEHRQPDADEIRAYLHSVLPRAMVPADICMIEQMPLTPSGKLNVMGLPVGDVFSVRAEGYVAPRDDIERCLVSIWSVALGIDQVGVHDNFFALHGQSLLATRVIARICEELELEVPLQCLFEAPTVAGLARNIQALRWAMQPGDAQAGGSDREVVRL